jgi:hypothetical protein
MKKITITILALLIICIAIHTLRLAYGGDLLMGSESYYNLRIAEEIPGKGFLFKDDAVFSNRNTFVNPYQLLIKALSYFVPDEFSSVLIPVILGIISLLLLNKILEKTKLNETNILFATLLLAMTPVFIYSATVSTTISIILTLSLLTIYLFTQNTKKAYILSIVTGILLIPTKIFYQGLLLIALLLYSLKKKTMKKFILYLLVIAITSLTFYSYAKIPILGQKLLAADYARESISELGGLLGLSPFFLILAVIGIIAKKKEKISKLTYLLMIIIICAGAAIGAEFNIFLAVLLSPFSANGLSWIINRKWELKNIKDIITILLICGILFSTVAYSKRLVFSKPDYSITQSLEWFSENSNNKGYVFSHYKNGFWIEETGKRRVLLDELSAKTKENQLLYNRTLEIYYSRNLKNTKKLLDTYNISYIFIDKDMKEGLVWEEAEEGLLFLLGNNETFQKRYKLAGVEVWEYVP